KFASEPPLVRTPRASAGKPRNSLNQSSTSSSTCAGPAASSQTPAKKFVPAQSRSPSTDRNVGAPGTKAKKRGWFTRKEYGATLVENSPRTAAKSRPLSGGSSRSNASSSAREPVRPIV